MRAGFLFCILCLCFITGRSQQKELDSLETEINKHAAADTTRLSLLNQIAFEYYLVDPEKGLHYSDEQLLLAKKLNNPKELAGAYSNKGINLWAQGQYSDALAVYKTAEPIYEKLQLAKELANLHNRIATVYYSMSNYPMALETYFQNLKIFEKLKDSMRLAITYGNIALCYTNLDKHEKAIDYYQEAIEINEKLGRKKDIADNYTNLGNVYDNINQPQVAIDYYQKALNISRSIGYSRNIASSLSNIGIALTTQKKFNEAYDYLLQALPFCRQSNNKRALAVIHKSFADIFMLAPQTFYEEKNFKYNEKYTYVEKYLDSSMQLYLELEEPSGQAEVWKMRSSMDSGKNDYKEALNDYKKYRALSDSIFNDEKKEEIAVLETGYAFSKREDSIRAENEQMALAASAEIKRQSTIKTTSIIASIVLFIAAITSFIFYKRKRDAVQKQQEAELRTEVSETEMKALKAQMNPHFIFNSLNSISDYISKNNIKDADKYLSKFAKLMRLILENSEKKEISLEDDLKALELYMQLEALRMNNKFTYTISVDTAIDPSYTLIPPLILQPFVENSIWHGIANKDGNGQIVIYIQKSGQEMIACIVEDNGVGRKHTIDNNSSQKEKASLGMKITQERINILNKTRNTNAGVSLVDLPQGLRVEVKLPFITTD